MTTTIKAEQALIVEFATSVDGNDYYNVRFPSGGVCKSVSRSMALTAIDDHAAQGTPVIKSDGSLSLLK
jgi:hypothetical protein